MLQSSRYIQLAPNVVMHKKNDEALLLKLDSENVFALNTSATRIVTLLSEGLSVGAIVESLAREYGDGRSTDIDVDVERLVESLIAAGLVVESNRA